MPLQEKDSADTEKAACVDMPLPFPAMVLCKKDIARIGQGNMLNARWYEAQRIQRGKGRHGCIAPLLPSVQLIG